MSLTDLRAALDDLEDQVGAHSPSPQVTAVLTGVLGVNYAIRVLHVMTEDVRRAQHNEAPRASLTDLTAYARRRKGEPARPPGRTVPPKQD